MDQEILHLPPEQKIQHFEIESNPEPNQHFDFEPNFELPKDLDFQHFDTDTTKAATPVDLPLLEILEPQKKKKDSTPEFEKTEAEIISNSAEKPQRVLSDKVKEELARNELIFQAQLLEKDKELHAKEKQVQMIDHQVHALKMELKTLTEGNVEMM